MLKPLLCLLNVITSVYCMCYGTLGEPVLKKDGDYLIGGVFNMGKLKVVEDNDTVFECVPTSRASVERAISFAMTLDGIGSIGNNKTLGYEIYDGCGSHFISRHVSSIIGHNDKFMGLVGIGKQNLVEASIASATSTWIPSFAYIYSDGTLLDKTNYPSLVSLIETEEMEADGMIKLLKKLGFKHVDIWYHEYSGETAGHVYKKHVQEVGCGRLTEFNGLFRSNFTMEELMSSTYNISDVPPASAQVLLFNSFRGTKEFLEHVLNVEGWKGKTFIFGYSNGRRMWADTYVDIMNNAAQQEYSADNNETENTMIFFQSELLNLKLDEVIKTLQGDTPTKPNALWQRYTDLRNCTKSCPEKVTSSWIPFVVFAAKILAHQLEHALEEYAEDGEDVPCTETLRGDIFNGITEHSAYDVNAFGYTMANIHFLSATFAKGYTLETYRRSHNDTNKFHMMGSIGYYTEKLDEAEFRSVMPSSLQQSCSVDCLPGTYRYYPDIRKLPCCWNCLECHHNQISKLINADTCTVCTVNESSTANHTECIPVSYNYIKYDSLFFLLGLGLTLLGTILTICVFVYINRKSGSPIVKASDPTFCYIFLSSLLIGFIVAIFCIIKPSSVNCTLEYFGALVFASLITSSLSFRCGKIWSLFAAANEFKKPRFSFIFTEWGQYLYNLFFLALNVGLGTAGVIFRGWVYHREQDEAHKEVFLICQNQNALAAVGAFILPFLLFIGTLGLAFKMRKFPHNFSETSNIFMATLVVLMSCVMFLTGYKLSPSQIKSFLRNIVLFTTSMAFLACMFIPKIVVLLKNLDEESEKEMIKASVQAFSEKTCESKVGFAGAAKLTIASKNAEITATASTAL